MVAMQTRPSALPVCTISATLRYVRVAICEASNLFGFPNFSRLLCPESAQAALPKDDLGSWSTFSLAAILDGEYAALALSEVVQ